MSAGDEKPGPLSVLYNDVMPMVPNGHKTLVRYPDGTSKVITLYTPPVEGQIIAHGWEVTNVAPGGGDGAEYEISVVRPQA